MKASTLLSVLDLQDDQNNIWLFTPSMWRILFPLESNNSLKISLQRHVKSGLLKKVKKGLYANERAKCCPSYDKLNALVTYLKPGEINYISQESQLSDLGVISQIPLTYLSLMTTGNSQTFETCYGTVQFTCTKRDIGFIFDNTSYSDFNQLLVANEHLALRDLKRSGRNWGLVLEQRGKDREQAI
tara:strand:+ start:27 stop:584 length:558 start_codon:yes stop_codon:yes gene_type:complete